MKGDLHTHSLFSDGGLPVEKLPRMAAAAGLTHLAITDHDTFLSVEYAQAHPQQEGVTLIPGVEISAWDFKRSRKVHVLCYAPRRTPQLEAHFENMKNSRNRQQRCSIEKLVKLYPFIDPQEIEARAVQSGVLFKGHIMRSVREYALTDKIYGSLYRSLLGKEGSCYAGESFREPVENIVRRAREAGAVVVIAHPGLYGSLELTAELAAEGLIDGVEIDHTGNDEAARNALLQLAKRYDLLVTGGTDYHGMMGDKVCELGDQFTRDDQMQRLLALLEERQKEK